MNAKMKTCIFFFFILLPPDSWQIRVDTDGGYVNVTIQLSENVEFSDKFLENIRNFFTRVSEQLFVATFNRTFIKSIEIEVPESWPVAHSQSIIQNADVRIHDATNDLFAGHRIPHTQQPRGCGRRGNFVYLTTQYIDEWNKDDVSVGKFIREWAKLRYGVFEETPTDSSFTDVYTDEDGKQRKTGCASAATIDECDGEPNCEDVLANRTDLPMLSSIMDDPSLKGRIFCNESGDNVHDALAPTRHNALCEGKSTWQIISQSSDFSNLGDRHQIAESLIPVVTFVKRAPMLFVVVIDPLLCISQDDFLFEPLMHHLKSLPESANVSFVMANSTAETLDTTAAQVAKRSNQLDYSFRRFLANGNATRSLKDGIGRATEVLDENRELIKHLVVLTNGSDLEFDTTLSAIESRLENDSLAYFFLITWPSEDDRTDLSYDSAKIFLDHQEKCLWFDLPTRSPALQSCNAESKEALDSAFVEYFSRGQLLHKTNKITTTPDASGQFRIPARGAAVYLKTFYCEKSQRVLKINVDGESSFDVDNDKEYHAASFPWTSSSDTKNPVAFDWEISTRNDVNHVTSVWSVKNPIYLSGQIEKSQNSLHPTVLYGYYSGNLSVKAKVVTPNGTRLTIELKDSGNDPDVRAGDGIFTRNLFYPEISSGVHSISMIAVDGHDETMLQTDLGNLVLPPIDVRRIPPSRIVDLRSNAVDAIDGTVTFDWTSPGGDSDYNSVEAYFLNCEPNASRPMDANDRTKLDLAPKQSGNAERCKRKIAVRNTTHRCYAWSIDSDNNTSEMSNVVTVFVPELPTTTVEPTTTESGELTSNVTVHTQSENLTQNDIQMQSSSTAEVAAAKDKDVAVAGESFRLSTGEISAIGVGILLLIIVIIVAILCFKHKRKRKPVQKFAVPHVSSSSSSKPNNRADVIRAPSNRSSAADIESIPNDINATASIHRPRTSFRSKPNRDRDPNRNEEELPPYDVYASANAFNYATLTFDRNTNAPPAKHSANDRVDYASLKFDKQNTQPSASTFRRTPHVAKPPNLDELYAKIDKNRRKPPVENRKIISVTQV